MKEDLLMRRGKISDEIDKEELELQVPVMEYNFNDIKRDLVEKPYIETVVPEILPKRYKPDPDSNEESKNIENAIQIPGFNGMQVSGGVKESSPNPPII